MPRYVDGFVVPVPKRKVAAYRAMAAKAGKLWKKHGALEYLECVGDDLDVHCGMGFPQGIGLKAGETVFYSFIIYASKADRDRINAKVMSDPALQAMVPKAMPFDSKRMLWGGFKALVDA